MKRRLLLALALCLTPGSAHAQGFRVLGLNVLPGSLPPADLNVLDGLGTASCPPPAGRLDRLLSQELQGQGANLSCGNRFEALIEFPGPAAAHPWGSYAELARRIQEAKSSVLLANMVWDEGQGAPGQLIAAALADLRRNVLAHPEQYPQGMSVRVLLGNSVRPDRPADPRANLDYAVKDLLGAGLDLSGQAEGGWRLDVANFSYAAPHSHLKLLVLDGEEVVAGGYNISTLHLSPEAGGKGLRDLGLVVRGPIARNAVAAFYDTWQLSERLTCPAGTRPGTALSVRRACPLGGESAPFTLLWPPAAPAGTANVYSLYRRSGVTAADHALVTLLGAATTSIDLLQTQVSGDLSCDLTLGTPQGCDLATHGLPAWQAVADALRRGVHVRLVLDQAYPMKFEAAALVRSLQDALAGTGAADRLEVRWAGHPMHTKAIVVDGEMAVFGSTNLHFSSFGPAGLSEYTLATSDAGAIARMQGIFEGEWKMARPFTFPWWAR